MHAIVTVADYLVVEQVANVKRPLLLLGLEIGSMQLVRVVCFTSMISALPTGNQLLLGISIKATLSINILLLSSLGWLERSKFVKIGIASKL